MSTQPRRPQDWTAQQKLDAIIQSCALEGEALSGYCRKQGIFAHHIKRVLLIFGKKSSKPNKKDSDNAPTENDPKKTSASTSTDPGATDKNSEDDDGSGNHVNACGDTPQPATDSVPGDPQTDKRVLRVSHGDKL